MNRFIIIDALPYFVAKGNAFAVKLNDDGFEIGERVEFPNMPSCTYSELEVKAKCGLASSIRHVTGTTPESKKTTRKDIQKAVK